MAETGRERGGVWHGGQQCSMTGREMPCLLSYTIIMGRGGGVVACVPGSVDY